MDPVEKSFEDILAKFKSRLTAREQQDFEATTLDDVRAAVLRIQNDQVQTQSNMNFTRIQSFLEAMEQFSGVIQIFVNTSDILCFVWGPMKFVLQTASTWVESFETLLNAYEQIGKQIPMLEQYKCIFEYSPRMRQVLAYIYMDILEFHKRAVRFFSGRAWRQIFRSVWKDFNTRFKSILDRLRHHRSLVIEQAGVLHYQEFQSSSQELRDNSHKALEKMEHFRQAQDDLVAKIEEQTHRQNLRTVLEWLAAAQSNVDHEEFCNARSKYPKSGEWILKHAKVRDWMSPDVPPYPVLWINGIPGAGKTVLASVIIEDCLSRSELTTAYFYCKEEDPEKSLCISVFRGIITHLLLQCPTMVPFCYDRSSTGGELTLSTLTLAKTIFELLCRVVPKTCIVIDGLDECPVAERRLLIFTLLAVVDLCEASEPGRLRILFVSQDFADIKNELRASSFSTLSLELHNTEDIEMFVSHETCKLKPLFELSDQQIEHIKYLTCARAKGMFLFAKLVMENLRDQRTKHDLLLEITEFRFPDDLVKAYERIMNRLRRNLKHSDWDIVRKLLGWMVCAKRALKWHEIQGAISLDTKRQTVAFDEMKLRVHIYELCGSLVRVLPGDRIELVHNTAKLYITKTGYVDTMAVECELAALCLQYLTFPCFEKSIDSNELRNYAVAGLFVLQDYAVPMWSRHLGALIRSRKHPLSVDYKPIQETSNLETALDDFIMIYPDLQQEGNSNPVANGDCEPFRSQYLYDSLLLVWNHILQHQAKGFNFRNDISIPSLMECFFRNRELVETLYTVQPSISQYYGDKPFKCPKLTCFYFHEGFKEQKAQQNHIARHDRPFNCTIPDCSGAGFGFTNGKDLQKHMRFYHPEEIDLWEVFHEPPKTATEDLRFECHLCPRKFTRKINLTAHLRNHSGERPFGCSECGKSFTRASDCRRHEKLHDKRR